MQNYMCVALCEKTVRVGVREPFLIYLICPGEGISGRVRQQGRDVDTASLNQRDDLCLRSPHRKHYVGLRWGLL